MTDKQKETAVKAVDVAIKIAVGMILFFSTSTVVSLGEVKASIAVLEERVSSVQERVADLDRFEERLRCLEQATTKMAARLPTSFPPPDTKQELKEIRDELHRHIENHK